MIIIHWDYSTGSEKSYAEVKQALASHYGQLIHTHVLDFFNTSTPVPVWVLKEDGSYIDRDELRSGQGEYTPRDIRKEHNIHKMLIAGAFDWHTPTERSKCFALM